MSIPDHRKAIDRIDRQIVRLLNDRASHAYAIGVIKTKQGEEVYAPHRESAVLQRVAKINRQVGKLIPGTQRRLLPDDVVRAVYREIMSGAIAVERPIVIAYLGPEATFTHEAALRTFTTSAGASPALAAPTEGDPAISATPDAGAESRRSPDDHYQQAARFRFGSSLKYHPVRTIGEVFAEVMMRRADFGVVPVENSTEGVVTHTLDMFIDSELKIVAQIVMPISQCLMSQAARAQITKLFIHPQSLAQSRLWIQSNLPHVTEIIETSSNARSAELASKEPGAAAIAGLLAAEKYGLPVLEHNVQDNAENATRFLVLGRESPPRTGHDRTSLMFCIADRPGALHGAIAPFRKYRINMTKIESRPSKRKAWQYYFFVDCDGHAQDPKVAKVLEDLAKHCVFVKVLGSYPNTE